MVAPNGNLQNIKQKHANQPAQQGATTYCTQLSPLLDCHGWKQLIFKTVCICKMFFALLWTALRNWNIDLPHNKTTKSHILQTFIHFFSHTLLTYWCHIYKWRYCTIVPVYHWASQY
jgi:hypothetical protein